MSQHLRLITGEWFKLQQYRAISLINKADSFITQGILDATIPVNITWQYGIPLKDFLRRELRLCGCLNFIPNFVKPNISLGNVPGVVLPPWAAVR